MYCAFGLEKADFLAALGMRKRVGGDAHRTAGGTPALQLGGMSKKVNNDES